ncbi:MAG: ROK family protein [Proteobacteria bacterium]|nr:ROK family protein [Pseudomonadota bacterium]
MFLIGFDVGGTKIEATLFKMSKAAPKSQPAEAFECAHPVHGRMHGEVLARLREPTERHKGYDSIAGKIASLIGSVCSAAGVAVQELNGIGLGLPGSIDPQTFRMLNGNTMVLVNQDLIGDVRRKASVPASVAMRAENDANCFALAEALCGAGLLHEKRSGIPVHAHTAVGIILGTGCGGGIVMQGRTLQGARGGGGELGHTVLHRNGHQCYCGQSGCAEQYLSGPAIESLMATRHYSQLGTAPLTARDVFEKAQASDPAAMAVVLRYKDDLARFLGGLTSVFDPHYFVLGGGISLQSAIYEGISESLAHHTFLPASKIPVYRHQLGDSAGGLGAALLSL